MSTVRNIYPKRGAALLLRPFGEQLFGFFLQCRGGRIAEQLLLVGLDQSRRELRSGCPVGHRECPDVDVGFRKSGWLFGDDMETIGGAHDMVVRRTLE